MTQIRYNIFKILMIKSAKQTPTMLALLGCQSLAVVTAY